MSGGGCDGQTHWGNYAAETTVDEKRGSFCVDETEMAMVTVLAVIKLLRVSDLIALLFLQDELVIAELVGGSSVENGGGDVASCCWRDQGIKLSDRFAQYPIGCKGNAILEEENIYRLGVIF